MARYRWLARGMIATEVASLPSARSCATAQAVPDAGSVGPANRYVYTFGGSDAPVVPLPYGLP